MFQDAILALGMSAADSIGERTGIIRFGLRTAHQDVGVREWGHGTRPTGCAVLTVTHSGTTPTGSNNVAEQTQEDVLDGAVPVGGFGIVRGLIVESGGDIRTRCLPGVATTVRIRLPLAQSRRVAPEPETDDPKVLPKPTAKAVATIH